MSETIIKVTDIAKRYRIGIVERHETFSGRLKALITYPLRNFQRIVRLNRFSGEDDESVFWALKNINFEVRKGEVLGIIGKNGAGKSTLLKILSRITEPTHGTIEMYGRVSSLLEVGTGFHPELSGRDNVYMNGTILGMTKKEIDEKFDEIIEFSGIERHLDTPVKFYSSGMKVRLAFAVAAHLDPEIMIIDEVLAVGDADFQQKCLGKMNDVAGEGRTVLFVSHDMAAVRQLCTRAILLSNGEIKDLGDTEKIIDQYLKKESSSFLGKNEFAIDDAKNFQLIKIEVKDSSGKIETTFESESLITIELLVNVNDPIPGLYGYLQIKNAHGMIVLESDSFDSPPNNLDGLQKGKHTFSITLAERLFAPGTYTIYLSFASKSAIEGFDVDSPGDVYRFKIVDSLSKRGNKRKGVMGNLLHWDKKNNYV